MPIDVICGGCDKRYRFKQQSAGKRFRCKACGNTLAVSPPAEGRSRTKSSSRSPSSKEADRKSKADLEPIPDPFADDYDKPETEPSYNEFDDLGDDFGDDYAAPLPKKRKKKKSAVKTKSFKKSKPKSSLVDGLPPMTFNLNRLNAGLVIIGFALLFAGVKELLIAAGANSTAVETTLESLYADGPGDNVYLTITGAAPVTGFYVATESRTGRISEVWYACAPVADQNQPRFLLYSTQAHTEQDVIQLMSNHIHTGMLISHASGLDDETKGLFRENVPGIDVDTPMIFQVGRSPSSFFKWAGLILGGVLLLLGGLFWIFFVHD